MMAALIMKATLAGKAKDARPAGVEFGPIPHNLGEMIIDSWLADCPNGIPYIAPRDDNRWTFIEGSTNDRTTRRKMLERVRGELKRREEAFRLGEESRQPDGPLEEGFGGLGLVMDASSEDPAVSSPEPSSEEEEEDSEGDKQTEKATDEKKEASRKRKRGP
jgi:hypothetical protein